MADIVDLSGVCPRATSALDIVRADLARVTAMYFVGAPVYDQMHALEDKLFGLMRPKARPRPSKGFHPPPSAEWIFQDQ
jgi:hypothetical protein